MGSIIHRRPRSTLHELRRWKYNSADILVIAGLVERANEFVAGRPAERVHLVRAVDRDPRDAVAHVVEDVLKFYFCTAIAFLLRNDAGSTGHGQSTRDCSTFRSTASCAAEMSSLSVSMSSPQVAALSTEWLMLRRTPRLDIPAGTMSHEPPRATRGVRR